MSRQRCCSPPLFAGASLKLDISELVDVGPGCSPPLFAGAGRHKGVPYEGPAMCGVR